MRAVPGRRISRTLVVAALVATAALSAVRGRCDDVAPLAPQPILDRLGRAAQELAKKGRRAECDEALAVLRDLRAPTKDVETQRLAATKTLAKAKDAGPLVPDVGKSLTKLAADLAGCLAAAPEGEARTTLARQVLRLDATVRDAHLALDDVERDGRFVPKAVAPCLARRAEIQEAVGKARRLEVNFEIGPSALPVIERLYGKKGTCLRYGELAVHSVDFEPLQLERELREVMRAVALSHWFMTGKLEIPKLAKRLDFVFISSHPTYLKALSDAGASGEITPAEAEAAKGWLGYAGKTHSLFDLHAESEIRVWAFYHCLGSHENYTTAGDGPQTALYAGHINWLYTNFLGASMPAVAWVGSSSGKTAGETHDTPAETEQRKEMVRLARAGLQGTRRFMAWLAHRGEDPAWSRSMVPGIDKLGAADLMKSTIVVDWLQETGEFAKLYADTNGKPGAPATFEPLVPGGLAALEGRWREWLFADEPASGLVQRLTVPPETPTAGEAAATRRLDALRSSAITPKPAPVGIDRDLSAGCLAHAAYLLKHPKQQAAWPDAHEEYPGEEAWTPAGARAGLESVIYPGVAGADEAIDGWMSTFYHRLPLLDPGLLRIGFGLDKGVAVLDAGGLVAPPEWNYEVHWPPTDAKAVPRRFVAEMPNPVPGEDQAAWGYPVTVQLFGDHEDTDIAMKLFLGNQRGVEVPCRYSTPRRPTNPLLVPPAAYCLIPKATLAAGATYTVTVEGLPKGAALTWSFATAAK
jgi:hypothetical protein